MLTQLLIAGAKSVSILSAIYLDESGQDLIEYSLVACLVALGAVASMRSLGAKLATTFTTISTSLSSAI